MMETLPDELVVLIMEECHPITMSTWVIAWPRLARSIWAELSADGFSGYEIKDHTCYLDMDALGYLQGCDLIFRGVG